MKNRDSVRRKKSACRHWSGVTARVLATLLVAVSVNWSAAFAEGFPGIGDRLLYADSLPHYNLGNKYLAKEWYEKAIEKYWDAIGIYEFDPDVYVNLSVAYRKLGNISEAEKAARKAVNFKPEDWTTWSNLANLLMTQEKFPQAYKYFNKALKCPGMPESEKTFIESNIDGMKKIMKARGFTVEGNLIAPPAVAGAPSAKKRGKQIASKTIGSDAPKSQAPPAAKAAPSAHANQLRESEIDTGAYDQWVGGK